jgi:hypothetical protein
VAAGWAYDKYLRAEAPGLRERIKPEMSLDWKPALQPTHCIGAFHVSIQNIGKTDIDVKSSRLRVWIVPFPRSDSDKPISLSFSELVRDVQPFYDETLSGSESLMHGIKRPDEIASVTYSFLFKNEPDKSAVFYFETIKKDSKPSVTTHTWDRVCGQEASRRSKGS